MVRSPCPGARRKSIPDWEGLCTVGDGCGPAGRGATAVFVAPQKTLAMGVPLLSTYFAAQPEVLGIAMIPLLFYHPWQLLTAGVAKGFLTLPEPTP